MKSPAVTLLLNHYLDWQRESGQIKTMKEFAEHINLADATLNRIMNEKVPVTNNMLVHFARELNDPRFYALEGLPEPDLDFEKLMKVWQYIPAEKKRELREQGESYVAENKTKRTNNAKEHLA